MLLVSLITALVLSSCSSLKIGYTKEGATDDVYFTTTDIKKSSYSTVKEKQETNTTSQPYTGSYSDRLRNFGTTNRFSYSNSPIITPTFSYNPFTGWQSGIYMGYGSFGYMHNSPFSPYYGMCMPYSNPYMNYGFGNWGSFYSPFYYNSWYSPYNYYGYNDPYRNPYYGNNGYYKNSSSSKANYARRTGGTVNTPSNSNTTMAPQSNTTNNSGRGWSGARNGGSTVTPGATSNNGGNWNNNSGSTGGGNRSGGSSNGGGSTRRR